MGSYNLMERLAHTNECYRCHKYVLSNDTEHFYEVSWNMSIQKYFKTTRVLNLLMGRYIEMGLFLFQKNSKYISKYIKYSNIESHNLKFVNPIIRNLIIK